jgi:hypothetical protein
MINKRYVAERDKLIPFAERYANKKFGERPGANRDKWVSDWNLAFHSKMDELAKTHGITK